MDTLDELISDLDDRIKDEFEDLYDYPRQRDDKLVELAEEQVPEQHRKLAELLVSDNSLAEPDDDSCLGDKPTVWDYIGASVRERLISEAHKTYKGLEEDYDEMKDDLEAEGYQVGATARQIPTGKRTYYIYWDDAQGDEHIVKDGFKSEYECWTWLEKNEQELPPEHKAPK